LEKPSPWELIASVEYRQLYQIRQEIQEMAPPPYTLVEKGKNVAIFITKKNCFNL